MGLGGACTTAIPTMFTIGDSSSMLKSATSMIELMIMISVLLLTVALEVCMHVRLRDLCVIIPPRDTRHSDILIAKVYGTHITVPVPHFS